MSNASIGLRHAATKPRTSFPTTASFAWSIMGIQPIDTAWRIGMATFADLKFYLDAAWWLCELPGDNDGASSS